MACPNLRVISDSVLSDRENPTIVGKALSSRLCEVAYI